MIIKKIYTIRVYHDEEESLQNLKKFFKEKTISKTIIRIIKLAKEKYL